VGFYSWLDDIQPRILTRLNTYEIFHPTPKQKKQIDEILEVDENGNFVHSLSLLIEPRRHGKSSIFALIILWLFTSRQNFLVQLLGNTEQHCRRTQFRTFQRIIEHTPKLSKLIPEDNFSSFEVVFPPLGNTIQMSTGVNTATSFGEKVNVLWVSDFHAAIDLNPFNIYQSALLDSENSLCFIDSNVDPNDGHVHSLQREADNDDSMFCEHICYRDFEDFAKNAPPWIDRQKAKRLERTALPADFKRDILGQRSDAKNALFPQEIIDLCKSDYKIPVSDISALAKGRAYKVLSGLDRGKSLLGHDNTVFTTVAKIATDTGEPEFYLLNQQVIVPNTSRLIKKAILRDHQRYHFDNMVLENYETVDLQSWAVDQKMPCELVSAHDTNQNIAFLELYRIAKEGRLHFPRDMKALTTEMQTFTYNQKKGGMYSFGADSKNRHKDDRIYSLVWSIFAGREQVLNMYTVGNIQCLNKGPKRNLCFIMNQDPNGALLLCRARCEAYKEIEQMYQSYKESRLDSDETIQEFFAERVKIEGARISQAI